MASKKESGNVWIAVLLSLFFGLTAFAGLSFAFARLMVAKGLSQQMLPLFATVAIAASCYVNGWFLGQYQGKNGMLCGLLAFATEFALLCAWAWYRQAFSVGAVGVIRVLSMLIMGVLGGYTGMLYSEKRGRRAR